MKLIYIPSGKAKEYGDYVLNISQAALTDVFTVLRPMYYTGTVSSFTRS